jgi:peptidyl-tRNA hydrolase, PTH1 family
MKLIVGLGNPGRKYVGTRHNVGFDVVAELSRRGSAAAPRSAFDSQLTETVIGDERVLLAAPQTFMNLSGRAVRQILDFYKLSLADLLVVCDDLNLPLARLRLRRDGSAGGQKGLKNIIEHAGTEEFARLRIGIDRPPERMDATAYVLQKFTANEREAMSTAVQAAADAAELWITQGPDAAMNRVNAAPGPA